MVTVHDLKRQILSDLPSYPHSEWAAHQRSPDHRGSDGSRGWFILVRRCVSRANGGRPSIKQTHSALKGVVVPVGGILR